ncbi:GumC family protein [Laribacter hongkongensis]|uniref:GumC family protein n=1 Tax=Laribacter hongkongensis TaxID=168471 RepID=UPI001EFD44C6|nr:hypothetical protein [Laribacter hongkongensis]MCG9094843.1 hypothetical protein [Laribacter hongkongensis]
MEIQSLPGIGIKPLLSFQRHARAGLIAGLLVLMLGLPLVWIFGQSSYTAEAVFQVSPNYMKTLQSDKEVEFQSNSQYREFINQLSSTVTRFDVLKRALALLKAKGVNLQPAGLNERKYIEQLQKKIYVRPVADTYMVRIGIESTNKAHLDQLVNAVMSAFLQTTRSEQIYGSAERLDTLGNSADRLRSQIASLETGRLALADKLGLTTFSEHTENPYDALLVQTREKYQQAEIERWRAEAALQAFNERGEIPTDMGRSLLEMRLQDNGLQALRNEVTKRTEQLNQSIAGLEDKHPARGPALAEIRELAQRLQARENEFDQHVRENYLHRLQATLDQKTRLTQELEQSLAQLEGQAGTFAQQFQQAMSLTRQIAEQNERLKQVQDRLDYIDTERNAIGFVRLVTPALPPDLPMGIGKTKLLLALLAASFTAMVAVPVMLDMLGRRIRSVNEAEKLLGIPAAGWQIRQEDLPTRLYAEEQTRRFASALIRNKARSQHNVFAFTSVTAGNGTTTVILDTARALQHLGASVLLVEANTFSPFAGFSSFSPGLLDYLAGRAGLEALPHAYMQQDTSLQVIGAGPDHGTGLQRLDRLQTAMQYWSTTCDYVLVDLPPILLSADAEILTEQLGQVFLVVEADHAGRGEVTRAKRLLQKLDPEAVGLFVNDVTLFRGSGYMGEIIAATLTHGRMRRFASTRYWQLQWHMLRAVWALKRPRRQAVRDWIRQRRTIRQQRKKP